MSVETAIMPVQPLDQLEYVGHHRAEEMAPDAFFLEATSTAAESTGSSWRSRLGQIAGRTALVLGIAAGGTAAYEATDSTAAQAADVSCYGDYCSGQYADQTGCAQDAQTIADSVITRQGISYAVTIAKDPSLTIGTGNDVEIAHLEVRHSDNCGTTWARLDNKGDHSVDLTGINFVGIEQDGGYTQKRDIGGYFNGSPGAISFTPMIYGRGREYQAFVEVKNNALASRQATYWTAG